MIAELFSRVRHLMHRCPGELDEELQAHMDHAIENKIVAGLSPAEAKRQAAIELGSMARAIQSMLYGTEASDPATFVGMALLLLVVALAAGYLPARRAASISPMVALRAQ